MLLYSVSFYSGTLQLPRAWSFQRSWGSMGYSWHYSTTSAGLGNWTTFILSGNHFPVPSSLPLFLPPSLSSLSFLLLEIIFYISNLLLAICPVPIENLFNLSKHLIPICRWPRLGFFPKMIICYFSNFFLTLKFLCATNHLYLFVVYLGGRGGGNPSSLQG